MCDLYPARMRHFVWIFRILLQVMTIPSPFFAVSLSQLPSNFPHPSQAFATLSGLPVCRYALGGAARSSQSSSLPSKYYHALKGREDESSVFPNGAPFYFYYNPHRYPAFMSGVQELCENESTRTNLFVASGGTARSSFDMEQRLQDALDKCGGDYLDLFILEYISPYELEGNVASSELRSAIKQANEWKDKGRIRYVGASTHSHCVGAVLANDEGIDTVMLRYSMAHKDAADHISFPACVRNRKPVLAFCTTRWNSLQNGHVEWNEDSPTDGDCISFALAKKPPVDVVLHSARDEHELAKVMNTLCTNMSLQAIQKWRAYGDLDWNMDEFDEYPDERLLSA